MRLFSMFQLVRVFKVVGEQRSSCFLNIMDKTYHFRQRLKFLACEKESCKNVLRNIYLLSGSGCMNVFLPSCSYSGTSKLFSKNQFCSITLQSFSLAGFLRVAVSLRLYTSLVPSLPFHQNEFWPLTSWYGK